MKTIIPVFSKRYFWLYLILVLSSEISKGQDTVWRQTPHPNTIISPRINGFWEWLPKGYALNPLKKYPLIVYIHGWGEVGDGSMAQLPRVNIHGIPNKIESGVFPDTVYDHGVPYSFIAISPQYNATDAGTGDLDAMLNYAYSHYRVDRSRVYITGISAGAGIVYYYVSGWDGFAQSIAAIVPMSVCVGPGIGNGETIARNKVAVWDFHCLIDSFMTCQIQRTYDWMDSINSNNPAIPAISTVVCWNNPWPHHIIFWNSYMPNYRPAPVNMNIYEWMISHSRAALALPITLKMFDAQLNKTQVDLKWITSNELNAKSFIVQRAGADLKFSDIATIRATGNSSVDQYYKWTDLHPLNNLNYYRLVLVNLDGTKSNFEIKKVWNKGIQNRILFIAPNPVTSHFSVFINLEVKQKLMLSIIDMEGRLVRQYRSEYSPGIQQINCNVSDFAPGKYIIKVDGSTFNSTETIIKQ